MEETRKLRTVLFADIVGYTAMMQRDEQYALRVLNQFQAGLEKIVPAHQGKIVQYFGDGCLLTFESATEGVNCVLALQKVFIEQQIPVRIGMHLGEVIFRSNNAFGDGVNIASRVESMGVPGSVLVSKTVRDQVKNKAEFSLQPLGAFHFKNVDAPIELYALANAGLIVPKKGEMKGKLAEKPKRSGLIGRLWTKGTIQALLIYLVGVWLGIQILEKLVPQVGRTLPWNQLLLAVLIGFIPSLILYLKNQERIHQRQFSWAEIILFPSNLILVGLALFFMMRSSKSSSAEMTTITFLNSEGEEERYEIVDQSLRKEFALFAFEPIDKQDSANAWLGPGTTNALDYTLGQDKYLAVMPNFPSPGRLRNREFYSKAEKLERAKNYRADFYVDGQYQVEDGLFTFITAVRDKQTGTLRKEKRYSGSDLFAITDSVTEFIREAAGLSPQQLASSAIVGIKEGFTNHYEAYKAYTVNLFFSDSYFNSDLARVAELDSTFVYASLAYALRAFDQSRTSVAKKYVDRAMRFRRRLPFQDRIRVMASKHLIYQEWDKAEKLLLLQIQIEPDQKELHYVLSNLYATTGQVEKLMAHATARYVADPTLSNGLDAMDAALLVGKTKEVLRIGNILLIQNPRHLATLFQIGQAYLHQGDYAKARETWENILLIDPDQEAQLEYILKALDYMEQNSSRPEALSHYEGVYRIYNHSMTARFRLRGKLLTSKAENQSETYFYPFGPDRFVAGSLSWRMRSQFLSNEAGQIYAFKYHEGPGENLNYFWRQDSLIWQAESLLRQGTYDHAYVAYQAALEQHPEHFYLQQALQHLEFLKATPEEELQARYQKLVGDYAGGRRIWMEEGLLYYQREGRTKLVLRPISETRFMNLFSYRFNLKFLETPVSAYRIQGHRYDCESMSWYVPEGWIYEREK